jgi:hypothetical protein
MVHEFSHDEVRGEHDVSGGVDAGPWGGEGWAAGAGEVLVAEVAGACGDAGIGVDGDGREVGEGGVPEGAAWEAGIGAVEGIVEGGAGRAGERDGRALGEDAAGVAERGAGEEVGIHEMEAIGEPAFHEIDLALVSAGERVGITIVGEGAGAGAGIGAAAAAPAGDFAGLGFAELVGEVIDDGEDVVVGEEGGAEVLVPVDVPLPEIDLAEEPVVPGVGEHP